MELVLPGVQLRGRGPGESLAVLAVERPDGATVWLAYEARVSASGWTLALYDISAERERRLADVVALFVPYLAGGTAVLLLITAILRHRTGAVLAGLGLLLNLVPLVGYRWRSGVRHPLQSSSSIR